MLPAPLPPASTVRTALLPPCGRSRTNRSLAAVMPDRAPTSAFRTLEASLPPATLHRDARRIGPDPGRQPVGATRFGSLRLSPWSVFQRLAAFRTGMAPTGGASGRWVPSGGGRVPRHRPSPPGGSNRIAAFRQLGFPFGIAPVGWLPCRAVSVRPEPRRGGAFGRSFPGRGDPANGSAPLAASAVRQALREKERGVFSDAAAGIVAVSSGSEIPISFRWLFLRVMGFSTLPMT